MNCRKAQAHFSSYLEQEMSELERRAMAAHLNRCPQCSSDLFATQKAISLLRWVPRPQGSPDFTERVLERIHAESHQVAGPGWLGLHLDDFRQRCRDLGAALAAPAPAGALVAALLVGGGGGALLVGTLGVPGMTRVVAQAPTSREKGAIRSGVDHRDGAGARQAPTLADANPSSVVKQSLPGYSPAGGEGPAVNGGDVAKLAPAANEPSMTSSPATRPADLSAPVRMASSVSPAARTSLEGVPSGARRVRNGSRPADHGVEVAEWASGAKRIEGLPEGPPAITRVEYVLDQVDVSRMPVGATQATQVQEGSITF